MISRIITTHPNIRTYNLSSGPHVTHFSSVVAKKRINLCLEASEPQAILRTSGLGIFKLVLYFKSILISNHMMHNLAINWGNFLQIWRKFYRHALQTDNQLWWFVIAMACTKNSWKLIWKEPKELKALLLHEIVRASLFLLTEVA